MKRSLAFLAGCALGCAALAQPAHRDAPSHATLQQAAGTKALMAALERDIGRQDAFDAATRAAAARAEWSERDRVGFLRTILRSPANQAFDKRIASLTAELRSLQQAVDRGEIRGAQADARFVAQMRALIVQLRSVYERQSVHLLQQLREVEPAQPR